MKKVEVIEVKNRVSKNGFKAGNNKNTIVGDTDCDKSFNANRRSSRRLRKGLCSI